MKQFDYIHIWDDLGLEDYALWIAFIDAAPGKEITHLLEWLRSGYYVE